MPSRWYLTAYVLCCAALVLAQQPKKDNIAYHATGPFEVKLTPQPPEGEPTTLRRMTVDKQFHGELEAVSQGQMLSVTASTKGSAGYVAMEIVNGTLGGHRGTFVLQHSGTMNRGQPAAQRHGCARLGDGRASRAQREYENPDRAGRQSLLRLRLPDRGVALAVFDISPRCCDLFGSPGSELPTTDPP